MGEPVPESSEFVRINEIEDLSAIGDTPDQTNPNDALVTIIAPQPKYSDDILGFTEKSIQADFVRKVYSAFGFNFVLTCGILAICLTVSSVGIFFQKMCTHFSFC